MCPLRQLAPLRRAFSFLPQRVKPLFRVNDIVHERRGWPPSMAVVLMTIRVLAAATRFVLGAGVLPKTLATLLAIALSPQPEGTEPIDPTWRPQ